MNKISDKSDTIVMEEVTKEEEEALEEEDEDDEDDFFKSMIEEEAVLKRTVETGKQQVYGTQVGVGLTETANAAMKQKVNTYSCTRCGKRGHTPKYCPTIGDPAFDEDMYVLFFVCFSEL